MNESLIEYLADKQVGEQWRGFLAALGQTLQAQLPPEALRPLMRATGEQFASAHPLPACERLDDLELAISEVWVDRHWGWAELEEGEDCLHIRHHAAPLALAFGDPDLAWTGGFLEGAYQVWLAQLGAGPALTVRQTGVEPAAMQVAFELRR